VRRAAHLAAAAQCACATFALPPQTRREAGNDGRQQQQQQQPQQPQQPQQQPQNYVAQSQQPQQLQSPQQQPQNYFPQSQQPQQQRAPPHHQQPPPLPQPLQAPLSAAALSCPVRRYVGGIEKKCTQVFKAGPGAQQNVKNHVDAAANPSCGTYHKFEGGIFGKIDTASDVLYCVTIPSGGGGDKCHRNLNLSAGMQSCLATKHTKCTRGVTCHCTDGVSKEFARCTCPLE